MAVEIVVLQECSIQSSNYTKHEAEAPASDSECEPTSSKSRQALPGMCSLPLSDLKENGSNYKKLG